jgi:predicted nucleic acid-binding protein
VNGFLLDTNIVSELVRVRPSELLLAWISDQTDASLFISSLTLGEIRKGVLETPDGPLRTRLANWFGGPEGPAALFAGRILPFDASSALIWGNLMAEGRRIGRPRSALDMIIAASAMSQSLTIVTANERDFFGLPILNPLKPA